MTETASSTDEGNADEDRRDSERERRVGNHVAEARLRPREFGGHHDRPAQRHSHLQPGEYLRDGGRQHDAKENLSGLQTDGLRGADVGDRDARRAAMRIHVDVIERCPEDHHHFAYFAKPEVENHHGNEGDGRDGSNERHDGVEGRVAEAAVTRV